MRYIKLLSSVLALLLMLTANAYAATVDGDSTVDNIPEGIPDWALKPALEPGEEPPEGTDTGTVDEPVSERGYTTIYNADGTIRYTDDPALLDDISLQAAGPTVDNQAFFYRTFDQYTITECFLLLFLILGFCILLWKIIKGVF